MSHKRYKLLISYDGTHYSGWQIQPNAPSIQQKLQDTLKILLKEKVFVTGSGRTDAGVHALEQTAHFTTEKSISLKFLLSLNALLPKDIRIQDMKEVPLDFHARYHAKGKIYRYRIHTAMITDPFTEKFTTHITNLDISLLKKAATYFLGTHDFTSFANDATKGSAANNPIKTMRRLDVIEKENEVLLEFEADGFLYKMVRNIVGLLIAVSQKKIPLTEINQIFKKKDRCMASAAAPAKGLFLVKAFYETIPLN